MYIVIEGNVGTNKNKLINILESHFINLKQYRYEPIECLWNNPTDKGFTNGCSFILNRSKSIPTDDVNYIVNKCHLSFIGYVNACKNSGFIDETKKDILKELYKRLTFPKIDYLILLKSEPGYSYEKLIERRINNSDPLFITEMNKIYSKIRGSEKVLVLNIEEYDMDSVIGKNEILYQIEKFIPTCQSCEGHYPVGTLVRDDDPNIWKTISRRKKRHRPVDINAFKPCKK